jgi:hypothetical protein
MEAGAAILLSSWLLTGGEREPRVASEPHPPQPPPSAGAAAANGSPAPTATTAAADVLSAQNIKPPLNEHKNSERHGGVASSAESKVDDLLAQRDAAYKHLQTLLSEEPGFWECFEEWLFIAGINKVVRHQLRAISLLLRCSWSVPLLF